MLLTLSTTHTPPEVPASDLGFLLHKHPDRFQSFDLSFGTAHVFYTEASDQRCTICLMLDVDPVDMIRGKTSDQRDSFLLGHYVNDRPFVSSSFMSVAIAQVFGSALNGRCKDRPESVTRPLPLTVHIDVLPVRGNAQFLSQVFEPLGYQVTAERHPLDEQFPQWGSSAYYSVTLQATKTVSELLTHLYVLIPVFDNQKHYYVGDDELEKLLAKAGSWLAAHPEKDEITRRYLKYRPSLYRQALARLADESAGNDDVDETYAAAADQAEAQFEQPLSLHAQRHTAVIELLRASGAERVLDLGCGEGKLLRELVKQRQFQEIVGVDVSVRTLEIASKRLRVDTLSERQSERLKLWHGSLIYRDRRLEGFDAAAVVEVIEHLDPPRLDAFERSLFQFARPKLVVITTPNREYNVLWPNLPAGKFRHADHRFEWTRQEFTEWAERVAEEFGYQVRYQPVGDAHELYGAPSQMAIFQRQEANAGI